MKTRHWWGLWLMLGLPLDLPAEDRLALGNEMLALKAQTRACYLGFIKLYDAAYFRAPVAGDDASRCVRVSYLRTISAAELDESTRKIFRIRHGDAAARDYLAQLERVGQTYESVGPGDRYTYCIDAGQRGVLIRDGTEVIRFDSADFAERFLQIWVEAEDDARRPQWAFGQC